MRDVLILKLKVTFVHACLQDDFYDAVYRYYPDSAEEFCTKLVMTFHEVIIPNTVCEFFCTSAEGARELCYKGPIAG